MPASRSFAEFESALAEPAPPAWLSPPLCGLWHALHGSWDAAHDAVQDDTADNAWVHAALHREEGDLDNAGYWYRRARRAVAEGAVRDEYLAIARALLDGGDR